MFIVLKSNKYCQVTDVRDAATESSTKYNIVKTHADCGGGRGRCSAAGERGVEMAQESTAR